MYGKMSFGMLRMAMVPSTPIRTAMTTNVYGRRRANLTIHTHDPYGYFQTRKRRHDGYNCYAPHGDITGNSENRELDGRTGGAAQLLRGGILIRGNLEIAGAAFDDEQFAGLRVAEGLSQPRDALESGIELERTRFY